MESNSFFMLGALQQIEQSHLVKLHHLIDWSKFSVHLKNLYKRDLSNAGGQEPYPALSMFKLVLLGQWHGLSDKALEEALKVRLDFMVFTQFEMGLPMPDESTICRFRNRLLLGNAYQNLFKEINHQLETLGLKVQGAHAALVDATIIQSAARPRTVIDGDKLQEEPEQPSAAIEYSADSEARWLKKGKKNYFGYRGFASAEDADGYIEHVHVTPANHSEQKAFPTIADALSEHVNAVLTDKGFSSADNRALLKSKGIKAHLSKKASRGNPLTSNAKIFNKLIAKRRFKIEQAFGTMKRLFNLHRARYFGILKTELQMVMAAIGMNLLKAQRKLEALQA